MANELTQACQEVGLLTNATQYLEARGFTKLAQIANIANEVDEFMEETFIPFKEGIDIKRGEETVTMKMAEDEDELVVKTSFKCLWKNTVPKTT